MKNKIRHKFLNLRNSMNSNDYRVISSEITDNFFSHKLDIFPENKSIMLYSSFRNEAATDKIIEILFSQNKKICLPACENDNITVYEYTGPSCLKKDRFGILSPDPDLCPRACLSDIHMVIVPGIAFDIEGKRIGFGKGYYDRFLVKIPHAIKTGFCYEYQIAENIPADRYDIPMDYLLTESRLISCNTQS